MCWGGMHITESGGLARICRKQAELSPDSPGRDVLIEMAEHSEADDGAGQSASLREVRARSSSDRSIATRDDCT